MFCFQIMSISNSTTEFILTHGLTQTLTRWNPSRDTILLLAIVTIFRYTSPWKTAPTECPETSVTYYQPTPNNIPELRPHVYVTLLRLLLTITISSSSSKGKGFPLHAKQQRGEAEVQERVGGQRHLPLPALQPVPLYRMLDGPRDRFGRVRKISLPPGFEHRTVQHVATRYSSSSSSSSGGGGGGSSSSSNFHTFRRQIITLRLDIFISVP